jgi:hypothetical protein
MFFLNCAKEAISSVKSPGRKKFVLKQKQLIFGPSPIYEGQQGVKIFLDCPFKRHTLNLTNPDFLCQA